MTLQRRSTTAGRLLGGAALASLIVAASPLARGATPLNVDNVFDADPPVRNVSNTLGGSGVSRLGRFVNVDIRKRF